MNEPSTLPAYTPAPISVIPIVEPMPSGTPGIDLVMDQTGDTDLYCGTNQDVVLFQDASGFDLVFGFDPSDSGDMLAIEENVNDGGVWSVDQLAISDTDNGAYVDLGGGNGFLVVDVAMADLDASDFLIHPQLEPVVDAPIC